MKNFQWLYSGRHSSVKSLMTGLEKFKNSNIQGRYKSFQVYILANSRTKKIKYFPYSDFNKSEKHLSHEPPQFNFYCQTMCPETKAR